jgi:signal transduction histidine kinase
MRIAMLPRFLRKNDETSATKAPVKAIANARLWQRWLRWMAWLLPVLISLSVYAYVWYALVVPGDTIAELKEANVTLLVGAAASLIVGIFIYQIQTVLAQQVATSAELEKKVQERTRSITEVMMKLDEQNKALLALDKQKSEFVTLVSHELRAPLTNINGGLELLLSREQDLSPRTRTTLNLVSAEAQRLTRFVETILDVSAMEAGQLPVVIGPAPVAAAIRHVVGQFPNLPPGRLTTEVEADLPLALADEHYLQSVLFHLVDNALKYAPDSPVRVVARAGNGLVEIRVTDRGVGVPLTAAARLFDKFERLDVQDSQSVYGYGLGLYMCKRIVQALNGDIALESAEGQGATFVVQIPAWIGE